MLGYKITLPDKTGDTGGYHQLYEIGAGIPYEKSLTVSWEAGAYIEMQGKIPIPFWPIEHKFKTTYTTSSSKEAYLYIQDDDFIQFYLESNGVILTNEIQDLIY